MPAAFARFASNTPFIRTEFLVKFNPIVIAAVIYVATAQYNEKLLNFNICTNIKRTIFQQINTALEIDALANLIENQTGFLNGTVPKIIQNFYDTYGMITLQYLAKEQSNIEALTYDQSCLTAKLFVYINEYANME